MGNIVVLDPKELAIRIANDQKGAPKYVLRALEASAQKAKEYMIKKSPTDRGLLKMAWKVITTSNREVTLRNDQPYAGVIENGSRPFTISQEGREAIAAWYMRKVMRGEMQITQKRDKNGKFIPRPKDWDLTKEAESVSWAIAKNFEKVGVRGQKFVYKNFDRLVKMINKEMESQLDKFFSRRKGDNG